MKQNAEFTEPRVKTLVLFFGVCGRQFVKFREYVEDLSYFPIQRRFAGCL